MSTLFIQTKIFKLDLVAKPSFKSLSGDNIHNTFKPSYNRDAMGKWAVEIDNLCWALFGCEIKYEYNKENRMHYINNKLEHIHEELKLYIPSRC